MTTDKGESSKSGTEGGWGNTDPAGGWGVDKAEGGWGGGEGGGGWGSAEGGEGWGGSVGEGWGISEELGAWGEGKKGDNTSSNGNDQKGKRKEREREDVEMRDSSPPKTVGSFNHTSLSRTKPESAPPPLPPAQNTPPLSAVASKPARPIPLPRQKKAQLFEDGTLTKLALQYVKNNKEAEQVQEKPNTPSAQGPKGRVDLFSQVLK